MISYWIDDRRDPKYSLEKEKMDNITWLKEIVPALDIVEENAENIEFLYLDHFMDHDYVYGNEFLFLIMCLGKEKFKNLKTIFLHSSDKGIVEDMIFKYKETFDDMEINLEEAKY